MLAKYAIAGLAGSALLASVAFAQSPSTPSESTKMAPAAASDSSTSPSSFTGNWRASKVVGLSVYNDKNESLGSINDLLTDKSGKIVAVVIGVGGFLGLGEKQVAVDYTSLQWTVAADNTERFVLATTKDALTSAPDFKTVDDQPNDAASGTDATTSGTDTTASSSSAM